LVAQPYDAVLIVSFGGPEGPDDVLPFLEMVLRGRNVPRERMLQVAEHYQHFGGISPLNAQNRALVAALNSELESHGPQLRVYWGNRNWRPLLADTLAEMADNHVRRALALFTSAYSSYSSCRQYLENLADAQTSVGSRAPEIEKIRVFFNHPLFIEPMAERVRAALAQVPAARRAGAVVVYTAHSIPLAMSAGCQYVAQLNEAARLVSERLALPGPRLAYQSRSGPPQQPWLEPDVSDALRELHAGGVRDVVIAPIGFLSDHIEILWDLDVEARGVCNQLGINMIRVQTVGSHPLFVRMIRELIAERVEGAPRRSLGGFGPGHDVCPIDCCPRDAPKR
jgi:protoporphyrin/coproporphyrin ferrochelatase